MSRPRPPVRVWAFAVEPDRVQITWRTMGPGVVTFRCGDVAVEVVADGGPGGVVVPGLVPGRRNTVHVTGTDAGVPSGGLRRSVVPPLPPPGEELCRFATISDLHLGEHRFGYFGTMRDLDGYTEAYPVRAVRAALDALTAWGAELLAVKGDITTEATAAAWDQFAELVAPVSIPVRVIPGNHDNRPPGRVKTPLQRLAYTVRGGPIVRRIGPPRSGPPIPVEEGLARIGHARDRKVSGSDLPGIRIVMADTSVPHRHLGELSGVADDLVEQATIARRDGRAVWIGAHHHPMPMPGPHFWPPGVLPHEAVPLLRRIAAANPRAFYTAGHTHRNRRYQRGGVTCTEVGSPKDYPGTWAGYVVHEGGIRQVVYRNAAPEVLPWLEESRGAAGGAWGLWSPGRLDDRCFTLTW